MLSFSEKEKIETLETARKALELIEENKNSEVSFGPRGIKKIKGFSKKDMLNKAKKDAVFFEHIYDTVIKSNSEAAKVAYDKLITEAMVLAGQILQEADISPRTVSPAIDHEVLSEEEMVKYYKRSFNLILEQKFNKPNLKSEILFEDIADGDGCQVKKVLAPGVKGLMIKCAKTGVLDKNDPEAVAKYLSAENAVADAVHEILIPHRVLKQIEDYQNNLPEGYNDIFGNTISEKIDAFKRAVSKIAAIVAPFIFMKALEESGIKVQFSPADVAGLSLDNDDDSE